MPGLAIDLDIYPDEAALLEALKSGDKYACACMIKHHGSQMYAVAGSLAVGALLAACGSGSDAGGVLCCRGPQ